jgi:hypothetical protein
LAWGVAALFALAAAGLYVIKSPPDAASIAFEIRPPESGEFRNPQNPDEHQMNISPDGRQVAFSATIEGRTRIWLRRLDDNSSRPLEGTDNGFSPFWSRRREPDRGARPAGFCTPTLLVEYFMSIRTEGRRD